MIFYTTEFQSDNGVQMTAGIKARDDIRDIMASAGYREVSIELTQADRFDSGLSNKLKAHRRIRNVWSESLRDLKSGDMLIIQFPVINHSVFLSSLLKKLQKRGVKIILLIHDLETLRLALRGDATMKKKLRLHIEEMSLLKQADQVIVHNDKMRKTLASLGLKDDRMVSLEIFDYLIPAYDARSGEIDANLFKDGPIMIAGTLRPHKAQYAYHLPETCGFNLYGVGYEGSQTEHLTYHGAFPPDDLPFSVCGSFGLVWDGEQAETCSGVYGAYMKINNPHKTSMYLAAGIPVVIWSDAALADFIRDNHCGITVDSIADIAAAQEKLTDAQYHEMRENAMRISEKMRAGGYTKQAIDTCIQRLS